MPSRRTRLVAAAGSVALIGALTLTACAPRSGGRWTATEVPTDATFNGMWFTDSLNGWITGGGYLIEGGIVGRTRDGGRSWRFQSGVMVGAGANVGLGDVQFRDTLQGLAVGDGGYVLISSDGGESWRSDLPDRATTLVGLQFIDARNGWATGPSELLGTQDGGETWRPLLRAGSENGYLWGNAVQFLDTEHGWMVGQGGRLTRSSDGGIEWEPVTLPLRAGERPTLWDVTFCDARHGWVVGEQGSIFHTDDGGAHWSRQEHGVPLVRPIPTGEAPRPREVAPELETAPDPLTISAVRFSDASHGWAVGYYADVAESVVLRTDDGGAAWRVDYVQPGELLRTLFVLDANHAWAAGDRARTTPQVVLRFARADR